MSKFYFNKNIYILFFAVLFLFVFILSFLIGKYPMNPSEFFETVFKTIKNGTSNPPTNQEIIIFNIRLPRILAASVIGAGLSSAGAAYQALLRNPLVSPDILGVSAGAGFGAAISILLGFSFAIVSLNAFIGGLIAVSIAYFISMKVRLNPTLGMVLAGVMIGSVFSAGISFVKLIADPNNALPAITYWLMGSVANASGMKLLFSAVIIIIGMSVLFILKWKLNLLSVGEEEAKSMGVNVWIVRLIIVIASSLITAAAVSISGMIGWIGLVVPHLVRLIVGHDNRIIIPSSIFLGASFMLVVDLVGRNITDSEIPIGILMAIVGAPFFLYLILSKGNKL